MLADTRIEPFTQLWPGRLTPVFKRDIGHGHFAAIPIGPPDHERFLDGFMFEQDVFDLAGKHLESAHGDHVLDAIDDFQKAVFIQRGHIAGAQPAFAVVFDEYVLCRFGPVPIALHHLRAVDRQFARLPVGCDDCGIFLVEQEDFGAHHDLPDRARLAHAFVRIGRNDTGAFGQPISFDQPHAGGRFEFLAQRSGQRCAARYADLERREIRLGQIGMIDQCLEHGRHARKPGRAVFFDGFEDLFGFEARDHGNRRAGQHGVVEERGIGENMEEGQRPHEDFACRIAKRVQARSLLGVDGQIRMGEHGPFRGPGGPAGILQKRQRVRILRSIAALQPRPFVEQIVPA